MMARYEQEGRIEKHGVMELVVSVHWRFFLSSFIMFVVRGRKAKMQTDAEYGDVVELRLLPPVVAGEAAVAVRWWPQLPLRAAVAVVAMLGLPPAASQWRARVPVLRLPIPLSSDISFPVPFFHPPPPLLLTYLFHVRNSFLSTAARFAFLAAAAAAAASAVTFASLLGSFLVVNGDRRTSSCRFSRSSSPSSSS